MQSGEEKRFASFDTGSAGPAMRVSAFVTGPSGGKIDTELGSAPRDGGFVEVDEGADEAHLGVGTALHGGIHCLHEIFPAIGVDGVVTGVGGDDDTGCSLAFGETGCNREHDGVSKRDDRLLHGRFLVVAFWDRSGSSKQLGIKVVGDETQRELNVGHVGEAAMQGCERKFSRVMSRPVVEAQRGDDLHARASVVEGGHGIHPSAEEDDDPLSG